MNMTVTPNATRQRTRAWLGVLSLLIGSVAVWRLLFGLADASWPLITRGGPASLDEVLSGLLAWAGCGLAGWLSIGTLAALLAALPGAVGEVCERVADRVTPIMVRKGISVLIGTSLGTVALPTGSAAGVAPPHTDSRVAASLAPLPGGDLPWIGPAPTRPDPGPGDGVPATSPDPGFWTSSGPRSAIPVTFPDPGFRAALEQPSLPTEPAPDPRWLPDRPAKTTDADAHRLLAPAPRATSVEIESVTVRRGDSLWAIAARHLGADANDAEIAHAWPEWYAANRELIGADPNLIIAGQQLVPPTEGPRP